MKLIDISRMAEKFIQESPLNKVKDVGIEKIWDPPLVGIASADDPLFERLKDPAVIGEHHLSPREWLPEARSVISYFLPFSAAIRESNYTGGWPSLDWVYGRIEGQECNKALSLYLAEQIAGIGGKAVVPSSDKRFTIINRRSNWSERHAAYISGLGTFGLGKSLITSKGCAGRYSSIITDLELEATTRIYEDIYQYCNMCLECVDRCPASAIQEEGKDLSVCAHYIDTHIRPKFAPRYGCGKCQTAVPCENAIP